MIALLNLVDKSLLAIDFFDQFVLQVDHASLELFQLKSILALNLLFGDVEDLGEVTLKHFHIFALFPHDSLQTILARSKPLFKLIDLVFVIVALLGDFVEVFGHFTIDFCENALKIVD